MSEKTLQATPKRRQDARKKGQVLKSQEMVSAFMLLGFVALLKYWLPTMITKMSGLFQYVYGLPFDWNVQSISTLMINLLWVGIQVVGPIFIVGALIATASNYLQVKSLFTLEPLKPQLSRISLISGAKRMFGVKAWVELFKSLLKVILIGYFLYATIRDNLQVYPALQQLSIAQAAMYIGNALMSLAWKISISFVLIAVIDFLYQWWDYEKNLRMSHEEMKQEFKQSEGNPQIKSEIRRKQREMAMSRMMQDLKSADVVVTNPTHFAVALRYDAKKILLLMSSPKELTKSPSESGQMPKNMVSLS